LATSLLCLLKRPFLPRLKDNKTYQFVEKRMGNAKNDSSAGLTLALALVPEAVSFAFAVGVDS
jgi:MFS superfamily sulfate permease-like transporter